MKRFVKDVEYVFGMTNIDPTISGIDVDIWSEHKGAHRGGKHGGRRVKIEKSGESISVSIEPSPRILAPKDKKLSDIFKKRDEKLVRQAIEYVGNNYELFLRHSEDSDNSYNDLKFLTDLSNTNK